MLAYVFIYTFIDFNLFKHAIIFLSGASVVNYFIIIINKRGKHQAAKTLLSLLTPLYMSYIALIVFGKEPEFHVYLFVAALIPLFLWGFKYKIRLFIIITIIIALYSIIQFVPTFVKPKISLNESYIYYFRLTNMLVCFIVAGAAIILYQILYSIKEKQIIKQTEELKVSQAHKDKVYSIIGHDLRSPLGAFAGITGLFLNEYDKFSDDKRKKIIQSMNESSVSIQLLLENLLEWSGMQSGKIEKNIKAINLRTLAEDSLELHKELLLKKNISTNVDIDIILFIDADLQMISSVFRNLISNAIKFTDKKGHISIKAQRIKDMVNICIEDSGIGISKDDLPKLFDIRKSQKISGNSSEKGGGLGLLLCKDFVELHYGKIYVESEIGKGSKFCFSLPSSNQLS